MSSVSRPTPSSMGLVPDSDDNAGTSTETHGLTPPVTVPVSTSIPAVPRQLGSTGSSAPLMPVSPNTNSSMPIFQGVQNVYLHRPTITMANNIQHVSNADPNEQSRMNNSEDGTPLEVVRTDNVGYEKMMTTKANLHRDGKVVVKINTTCHDMFHGLRGRVLIVLRDVNGDAIGVTDKMCCTTRGGLLDFLTPSFGDDTFFLEFPREVSSLAVGLDIWQADDASVGDVLSRILEKAQNTSIAIAHLM